MARGKPLIGLDIGTSSIKIALLKDGKKSLEIVGFGRSDLAPETIVDGAIMNSTAVVEAIQDAYARARLKTKDVAIGVSGHSVIIKKISLPVMTPDELRESIQWEAEQYIPFDINDVNLDAQILNQKAGERGQMDVLLVAAKKEMVNDFTQVVTEAGLTAVCVDVDAFAIQNIFERNYEVPSDQTIVLANIGASVVNINVIANGVTTFTRDISIGGNRVTEEIQKQLNVSYEEAETLKVGGETGGGAEAVVPEEVERVVSTVCEGVASEIQRSLDFYSATTVDGSIGRLYLSGGTAKVPALQKVIEGRTGIPVEVMDPIRGASFDERVLSHDYMREVGPISAVALGLGLRRTIE
ncbi:MAG: type IV pilus assembly protein PilM [Deltaproteobacteria bacterium]|nr:type IV pilus assembly protein PilM [Deltaproteobacteria bacterium]